MKTIRLILMLASLAGLFSVARSAESVAVRGILISASNESGESDRRLAAYEPNLRRILRFESFRFLGEDSVSLAVPAKGALSLGEGQQVELATASSDGKTVLLKVRWGSVRHEYVLQRGGITVLGGSSTGKKGEVYAVILVGK
ncbi:hypothetical protein [Opitutus sp. GAS368]|jgi:hypothetical protein|uniref:hypothetical protein n=1 Tax=Opitutus sp. GAS368 TaxID=1882749 RepID=UPI00087C5215|nr:hypothetical protein [Opitutus sp. GAS368]SDS55418.1 hypothetical protein SAMN05444173_3240 [Opitutus sp. GAS368]